MEWNEIIEALFENLNGNSTDYNLVKACVALIQNQGMPLDWLDGKLYEAVSDELREDALEMAADTAYAFRD